MSVPPSFQESARQHAADGAKPGVKSDAPLELTAHGGGVRAASPVSSLLSVDDAGSVRLGRYPYPEFLALESGGRCASRSPAPSGQVRGAGRAGEFWMRNKGLVYVLCAQLFGTLMNVTTRILEVEGNNGNGYHPFQILFARMSITVICASIYMWRAKTEHFPLGMKEVRPLLIARGLTGFFGVFGMYYSLLYLPLADATVITFLAPSLACWACSYLLHEPFTRTQQIAAYISLFGVVLIARPVSLFSFLSHSSTTSPLPITPPSTATPTSTLSTTPATSPTPSSPHPLAPSYAAVTPAQRATAVGLAMLGVFGAAGAYTTMRWIGARAHPLLSVNYFAAWCTIVSAVMMAVLRDVGFLLPKGVKDWVLLLALGACGFVMQFLLAAGLQYEKSSRATNMVYMQMLFALAADKLVFDTRPGPLSLVGSGLILGSAVVVAMGKEGGGTVGKAGEEGRGEAVEMVRRGGGRDGDGEEGRGLLAGSEGERSEDEGEGAVR